MHTNNPKKLVVPPRLNSIPDQHVTVRERTLACLAITESHLAWVALREEATGWHPQFTRRPR
jgi:hypothetical protein